MSAVTEAFRITGTIAVDCSTARSNLQGLQTESKSAANSLDKFDDSADDASDSADDLADSADDAGDSAGNADSKFSTWTVTLGTLVAQAITTVIDKLADLVKEMVSLGIETETAFAQLETIAGTENIDDLKVSLEEMSAAMGVSASDLALVAYNAISAGTAAEDASDMVEAATKLATAGFTEAEDALSVLTTAINSYGDSAGTVTEISDSLVMVQNLGVTTIGELSSSMGKAIATGSAYSVNLSNLESAYVSITKAGISTEETTTYLNSMLNELGDSGSDVSAILQEETKKSFTELMEEGYSLADVLGILYESCGNDSTALMNLWSSAEAGKASNAIINQGLEAFNENLDAITNSAGATEDAYAIMADTMETKVNVMKTSFEALGLAIYDDIQEPLSNVVTFISGDVIPGLTAFYNQAVATIEGTDFSAIEESLDKVRDALEPIVDAVSNGLSWAYENVLKPFASWTIDTGLPALLNGVATALNAISTAASWLRDRFTDLTSKTNEAAGVLQGLWEKVKPVVDTVIEAFQTVVLPNIQSVLDSISGAFSAAWEMIQAVWDVVAPYFEVIWVTIQGIWNNVVAFFQLCVDIIFAVFEPVVDTISSYFQMAWEIIKNVWDAASSFFSAIFDTITGIFSVITAVLHGDFSGAWDAIMGVFDTWADFWQGLIDNIFNIFNAVVDFFEDLFNNAVRAIMNCVDPVADYFSKVWDNICDTVRGILDVVKDTFNSVVDWIDNAIQNILSLFDFEWSLPELKMPHFTVSGSFSLNPLSVPSFGIDWYAKAMEDGMIMNSPTIFGMDSESGNLLAGGEAGSETVVGTENLMGMIREAVAESRSDTEIADLLRGILAWLGSGSFEDTLVDVLTKYVTVEYNGRELGRLVRKYA